MPYMMCRIHLNGEEHAVGDLSDPVRKGICGYLQTPQSRSEGGGKARETSTRTIFSTQSATEKQNLSQQLEVDKD